jgi:hypothetical protein
MSILDKRMDLAGHEINPGQEAQRAMALILVIAGEGCMNAGFWRQVRRRRADRLQAGFFIVRDDRHRVAWRVGLLQNLDLTVDAEDVRHLLFEFRIAALQVGAYLVRFNGVCVENLAYGSLHQFRETLVPSSRPMFARMAGQEPRRPQLVRIIEVLRFLAGQRHEPCFASAVIVAILPGRALSSNATNGPETAARSMHRCTV